MEEVKDYQFITGRFGICLHPIAKDCIGVEVGALTVYFSYRTPVAFKWAKRKKKICENIWGSVTGRHLKFIEGSDRKSERMLRNDFEKELQAAFRQNFIICARNLIKERFGQEEAWHEPSDCIKGDMENG